MKNEKYISLNFSIKLINKSYEEILDRILNEIQERPYIELAESFFEIFKDFKNNVIKQLQEIPDVKNI